MHITDKVAFVLDEAEPDFKEAMLTYLKQHQAGETPDPACLFIAIIEIQNQLNSVEHDNDQMRQALTDSERETRRLEQIVNDMRRALFPR